MQIYTTMSWRNHSKKNYKLRLLKNGATDKKELFEPLDCFRVCYKIQCKDIIMWTSQCGYHTSK